MSKEKVRVRFAPSPTGYLHIGGARTALFNWLFARHHGGTFILRIEDTDRKRYVPDALSYLLESLRWLELDWDEGPEVGGDYGPYFQSQRLELYHKWADWLVEHDHAYRCYCTPAELNEMRAEQRRKGLPPGYDRRCRYLTPEERAAKEAEGRSHIIRFKMPLAGTTTVYDLIRGEITFENSSLDDIVLLKSDGYPTYHLANVIDDHFMEITHIMRAEEWISSAPRHALIYRAFGWEMPKIAHLPLILNPSGKGKLSKRKKQSGSEEVLVNVKEYQDAGFLTDAVFNFLANIGWSYDDSTEVFSREEAIRKFDIKHINSAAAALPFSKMDWLNGIYIRQMAIPELTKALIPFLTEPLDQSEEELAEDDRLPKLVALIRERIKRLTEAAALIRFAYVEDVEYDPHKLIAKKLTAAESLAALREAIRRLEALPEFNEEALEAILRSQVAESGLKAGQLFNILRWAITGQKVAPPLFGSIAVLGRETALRRLRKAETLLLQLVAET